MNRIGEALQRPDGPDKLRGRARYTADHKAEGMLYGVYVPAVIPAGKVLGIDAHAALAHHGVLRVLVAADMPRMVIEKVLPASSTFIPMQSDEIRHQGQPIAIVLGETLEAAEHGARLVAVRCVRSAFEMPDTDGTRKPPRAVLPDE